MWAQLITMRLKPGRDEDLPKLFEQLQAAEQPGSGLLRSTSMRDQSDPSRVYVLVVSPPRSRSGLERQPT